MSYDIEIVEQFDSTRPAQEVYNYVRDFARIQEWDKNIVASRKISDGAIEVGSQFELRYRQGFKTLTMTYTVAELTPPQKIVMRGVSPSFQAVDTIEIAAHERGCTLHWHAVLKFDDSAAKRVAALKNRIIRAGQQSVRDLATALQDDLPAPTASFTTKLADKFILPGLFGFTKFGYQRARKQWTPITADMHNKHVVITGATSGLGKATAEHLAAVGAELTLIGRDEQKCRDTVTLLKQKTGNPNIASLVADLSLVADTVAVVKRLSREGKPIDVLINNAGALLNPRQETSEGIEASFALLLLSPFILTEGLLPLLRQAQAARVINVSSGGMYATRLSVSNLESTKGEYRGTDAYARAKRGLVIIGEEWAKAWQGDNITVHNMHPGWAMTPGVQTSLPGFAEKMARLLRDSDQGADTIVWLASATEVAKTSGLFWLDRIPHTTHLSSRTQETAAQRQRLLEELNNYRKRFS